MPAFEVILRQPHGPRQNPLPNRAEAEIGDVMEIDGRPWMIIERQPPFELRRIERIICVARAAPPQHAIGRGRYRA
jgi:hypothetical protein